LSVLKHYLREKSLLLVLDNFEHLLTAAPLVTELLAAAPRLAVLATSREALRLYGEQEFQVPPLQVPDLKQRSTSIAIKDYESVDLFIQRARAVSPGLSLDENTVSIAAICVHLDGLPLALELAAARTRLYAPQALLARLNSRLDALVDGPRDLPARQKTLRNTLAWSYDLLGIDEQILFARLGVFVGGFTLESAHAICADGLTIEVATGLESLLNKSLLQPASPNRSDQRFMMLETMREYALEMLEQHDETDILRHRHANYYLEITQQAKEEIYSPKQLHWFRWFEVEHDNLRAALRWCLETDNAGEMILRLIANIAAFWELRGHWSEGRRWMEAALASKKPAGWTKTYADALHSIGQIIYMLSDYPTTRELVEEALAIYRELDDLLSVAHTLITMGEIETEIGDYQAARALMQEGYTIMRSHGDLHGNGRALMQLGWGAMRDGDYEQAREWLEQSLSLYTQLESPSHIGITTSGLGEVVLRQGDLDQATELLEKSLTIRREIGNRWGTAASLGSLGWVALLQGDFERATAALRESISIRRDISDKGGLAWCFEKLAEIALLQGETPRAARIFGAAAAQRASIDSIVDPADQPHYEQIIGQIRAELDEKIFQLLWEEGKAMTLDQVIAYVLPAD
jgi:predicted ATPase/Tfp pilus assembly protein PilF